MPATPAPSRHQAGEPHKRVDTETGENDDSDLSQDEDNHLPEESILYDHDDEEEEELSQAVSGSTLHDQLSMFVRSRQSLYQSILLYEPVWLGQLHRDVKEAGIKVSLSVLQDWLDLECITYRTESNRNKNRAAKEKKKTTRAKKGASQQASQN